MLKPTLIALAAMTAFDAIATGGVYRQEVLRGIGGVVRAVASMGWSMTLS